MQATTAFVSAPGGPDAIQWRTDHLSDPQAGEVQIRQDAVGVNYLDTYHRDGTYPLDMPAALGVESAGIVTKVGSGVRDFQEGDRVATFGPARGAYATARNVAATSLFKLPDAISNELAAAALLKACTVEALVERCAKVQAGTTCLVHAAAGGVGLILVQWLKSVGAVVIGTVSTGEKAAAAKAAGCDHILRYRDEDVAARMRDLTAGQGAEVIFDGIGMTTWEISLKSAARRGLIVSYGNAGGPVSGIGLGVLAGHGSLFVTRPTLFDYYRQADERAAGAAKVFQKLTSGAITVTIGQHYALQDAAKAHADLEAGRTTGSSILTP